MRSGLQLVQRARRDGGWEGPGPGRHSRATGLPARRSLLGYMFLIVQAAWSYLQPEISERYSSLPLPKSLFPAMTHVTSAKGEGSALVPGTSGDEVLWFLQ